MGDVLTFHESFKWFTTIPTRWIYDIYVMLAYSILLFYTAIAQHLIEV